MTAMKRILTISAVLSLFVCCTKPSADSADELNLDGRTVFSVDTEEINLGGGDSFRDVWKEGDRIGVYAPGSDIAIPFELRRSSEGKSEALFYGPVVYGEGVSACYPYEKARTLQESKMPVELASRQIFDAQDSNLSAFLRNSGPALAFESEGILHFRYSLGLLAVSVKFDETLYVKSMTLSSEGGLSGLLLVGDDGRAASSPISSSSITLDFGGELVPTRGPSGEFTVFRFVLPPATYPARSLSLAIATEDETINVALGEIAVERVSGAGFAVANVTVSSGAIPGFTPSDGYLE